MPMSKLNRRDVLRASMALCAAAAVPQVAAPARALGAPKKLVIVLASGGWDTTYALDPKPGSTEIDAPDGQLETLGGIPVLTHAERPSVKTFFERYASLAVVVNGLQVRSFVHSDCMKRVMTGTPSDLNPDVGAIAASELGTELPVPYLVLGNSALSGPLASLTARAGTTNQLGGLLTPDPASSAYPAGFNPSKTERGLADSWARGSAERLVASRGAHGENQRELSSFLKSLERQGLLRQFAEARGGFGERDYTPDLSVQVKVALDALEGGLCHSVMLELADWDTHTGNSRQSEKHEAFFAGLIALSEGLEQKKLLDGSLILVLSEMGRTPKLNSSQGKDHWPVTSALVFGSGVKGGRVIGGTDSLLGALGANLATGAVEAGGKQIQTGNLAAGVLALAGVDPAQHLPGLEPLHALGA
jgi:hypothetical protein